MIDKKTKNRILALILSGVLLTSAMSGCGNPDRPDNSSETESFFETEVSVQQPDPDTDFEYEINEEDCITIVRYVGEKNEVVIPSKIEGKAVTIIGHEAFRGLSEIKKVIFPEALKEIGYSAFEYCTDLTTVVLPNSLEILDSQAFAYCSSLESVNIPTDCLQLGSHQFYNSGLKTVTFSEGVTVVSRICFAGTKLNEVVFPNSLKEIHFEAFAGCDLLEKIVLNEGLITIVNSAFRDTAIEEVIIPKTVSEINENSFNTNTLKRMKFEGNAPQNFEITDTSIEIQGDFTVYYHEGAEGFTSPKWYGYPTELW